jgi:hypothetical protein
MPQTLEHRLEALERTVHALTDKVDHLARRQPGRNDWLNTFGWAKDDPLYRAKALKKLDAGS